ARKGQEVTLPCALRPSLRPHISTAVPYGAQGAIRNSRTGGARGCARAPHGSRVLPHDSVPSPSRDPGLSVTPPCDPAADGRPPPHTAAHQPTGAGLPPATEAGA